MKRRQHAALVMVGLIVIGGAAQGTAAVREAAVVRSAPCFSEPGPGQLPVRYLEKGDRSYIDSLYTDTAGTVWFRVQVSDEQVWASSENFLFGSADVDTSFDAGLGVDRVERARRYEAIRANPSWERRIKRVVRDGRICLGMKPLQVEASWGKADQKLEVFTIGLGKYPCWVYRGSDDPIVLVQFVGNTVAGWSTGLSGN